MAHSLLEFNDLNVSFTQGEHTTHAIRGVSFNIEKGETVALVGESGSGKSVTALSTVKLLPESAVISGSIKYAGTEMVGANDKVLRGVRGNDISFIFQEPMTSLNPLQTIDRQIEESLLLHQGLDGKQATSRTIELLDQVGIRDPKSRLKSYPHQLSGGQRQRVMIAMALANNPELLIADEPTTALDVTIQGQILELLASIQKEREMAMLFITHDLRIVRKIADRVCVMKDGKIIEQGTTQEVFNNPKHDYTRTLLEAEPTGHPDPIDPDAKPIISSKDLRVWFPIKKGFLQHTVDYVKAVNGAKFTIRQGETLGLVGESGSGKTTLALAAMRLISSEGPIIYLGKDIQGLKNRDLRPLRREMQMVFQDPYGSLSPRMTVEQIIAEGLGVHGIDADQNQRQMVADMMDEVGLDSKLMDRYPHEFSGGQRQRISIARAMILKPNLVILDEPTSALDMTIQVQIVDLLRNLQKKYGLAYFFISHDLRVVRALSHNVLVMKLGDIIESGPTKQIFENPQEEYTKRLMKAALD